MSCFIVVTIPAAAVGSDSQAGTPKTRTTAGVETTPTFQTEAEATAADLAAISKAHGWSDAQAVAYLASEAAIQDIAIELGIERPDAFVGTAIPDDPLDPPVLFVKGEADELVRGLVAQAPVAVEIRDGQPLSYTELNERTSLINDLILEAGYTDVSSLYDLYAGGLIDVEVVAGAGVSTSVSDVESLIPADVREAVRVVVYDEVQGWPDGAFGGMRTRDDGANVCTSGFTVERISTGLRGVASAGHCGIFVNEIVHPGHGTHPMSHHTSYVGSWGDFQWFTTTFTEADDFYADTSVIRDVTAVELQIGISQNEAVCAYGRSSDDADCTLRVSNVNVNCGPTPGNQVRMNGDTQTGGDSGGPWYWSTRAYGFHRGGCGTNGNDHFSVAQRIENAINVLVVTQ